ncbi:DoxX family protein [Ornithinicoccus halotolerans]|uniref:DoxX family protein n=1 Tax=Ornithinicoccus halotolerans TaxID=1748220 RepID=UPI0012968D29|nr:DoxX family protein [Ornithinicoccus halotolerans]
MLRKIARPLLASAFIAHGVEALQRPGSRVPVAERFTRDVAEPLGLPDDPELLVRVNGAVMAGAGALLAIGRMPRLAGAALAVSLLPSTVYEHRFWEETEPEAREAAKKRFYTNLGLVGGVLLASVDTGGRPGLVWRSRNAARIGRLESELAAKHTMRNLTDKLPF